MRAGLMRKRLVLQSLTETRDADGGVVTAWALLASVYAGIEPLTQNEKKQGTRTEAMATHKIMMRYRSGLTPSMRFLYGTRIFNIVEILNKNERNWEHEVKVIEVTP